MLHEAKPHPHQPDGDVCPECASDDIHEVHQECDQCEGCGGAEVVDEEHGKYGIKCNKCKGSGDMYLIECYNCEHIWQEV